MNKFMPEGSLYTTEKNITYISSLEGLEKAMKDGAIVEAPAILCDHKLNLKVDLGIGIKGVIPKEEISYSISGEEIKDIAILTRVGKIVAFKVINIEKTKSGEIIAKLSRKAAQIQCVNEYIYNLNCGDIIPACVTHIENFGAFVDIGCGIISLLSIDCISVSRISHPGERLCIGDRIYAIVKDINDNGRIYLSEKELLGSWEENAALFNEGETVCGIVRSIESYGVFIELKPNLAGLAEYRENLTVGQGVVVYIKSIIPDKMKIKLIIVDPHSKNIPNVSLEYFIDPLKVKHLDSWTYSPLKCKKSISTIF